MVGRLLNLYLLLTIKWQFPWTPVCNKNPVESEVETGIGKKVAYEELGKSAREDLPWASREAAD